MLPALHELEQAMGVSDQIAGLLAWWIGKPIADARDKRLKALQAAEQHSTVGGAASDQRVEEAKAALNDAASGLRSISRGQWQVRLYCWFVRYDLEAAADALIKLHNMTGKHHYDDQERQFVLDDIYVFLRAHLKRERVDEIKRRAERDKRLSKAKF
jgi:hypothetical protein